MTTTDIPATPAPAVEQAPQPAATASASSFATNGFSIIALVLGIVGIVAGQWLLAVAAIVFGFIARNREPQSRLIANWGLALGFVGALGWVLVAIVGVAILAPFAMFAPFWL